MKEDHSKIYIINKLHMYYHWLNSSYIIDKICICSDLNKSFTFITTITSPFLQNQIIWLMKNVFTRSLRQRNG